MRLLILISLFIYSLSIFATDFNANHRKGFIIKPTSELHPFKSGERATLQGEICVAKFKDKGATSCYEIEDQDFTVRAYFPDEAHEVDVSFTRTDEKIYYHYETPTLDTNSANSFTLVVAPRESQMIRLYALRSKIEMRITLIDKLIEKYQKKNDQSVANYFIKFKETLISIVSKINRVVDENADLLARLSIPLQVDNQIASPLRYSSLVGGYQMSFEVNSGSPIEGESAKIKTKIVNLTKSQYWFPKIKGFNKEGEDELGDFDKYDYEVNYTFNGSSLLKERLTNLSFAERTEKEFVVSKMSPEKSNQFDLSLVKIVPEKKKERRYNLGSLTQKIFVSPDDIAPVWLSSSIPNSSHRYVKNFPNIELSLYDEFGRIDSKTISWSLTGETVSLTGNYLSEAISPLPEGLYTLNATAKDFAGNSASYQQIVDIDRTAPQIISTQTGNTLTNNPVFHLPLTINDNTETTTQIILNGTEFIRMSDPVINLDLPLIEGPNSITVNSIDRAGNFSTLSLLNITLDSTPPTISDLTPTEGSTQLSLAPRFSGKVSEHLSLFKINSENITINESLSFEKYISFVREGEQVAKIELIDDAGNSTSIDLHFSIVLKVLNKDLITISPHPTDLNKLIISGAAYASRPNTSISFNAGFFNRSSVTSLSDGSFEIEMSFFTAVTLSATDPTINKSDSFTLNFNVDTTLSGLVLDNEKRPLKGVIVSIKNSDQQTSTDATGSFSIPNPKTGDQTLLFDGTKLPLEVTGPNKKFSQIAISVNLGTRQRNILENPIHLTPLMFDGSETTVTSNSATTVQSPHAEGVTLEIPAGSATFPNGTKNGTINMIEIPQEVTSLPPLEYAQPDTVIALEPSGTVFSTPVSVTLPNPNEFPAGMQVVILSKNSVKGIWEIDGLARVSDNGQTIVTEKGAGITHFSEIYAAPLGPRIAPLGEKDRGGVDTLRGSLSTQITLPSYQMNGQSVAPSLIYKSSWANPTAVISNIFDVPKEEFHFSESAGSRGLFGSSSSSISGKAWLEPESVSVQFESGPVISEEMSYTGIPQRSAISYAMDLSKFSNGVYPYNSKYKLRLRQMVIGVQTTHVKKRFKGARTSQQSFSETRNIEKVFEGNTGGTLYVNSKNSSTVGKGWEIAGLKRILNPNSPRLLIDDGNGEIRPYALNNTIDTLFNSAQVLGLATGYGATAIHFKWPEAIITTNKNDVLYKVNLQNKSVLFSRDFDYQINDIFEADLNHFFGLFVRGDGAPFASMFEVTESGPVHYIHDTSRSRTSLFPSGFQDGADARYNSFSDFTPGIAPNTMVVADRGNNRVRLVNLTTEVATTIAGNGQTYDNGDGGLATSASVYGPTAVVYDREGNLYISTERGYIRRVDPNGYISTIAGKPLTQGGLLVDKAPADITYLSNPQDMVIDHNSNYLYVADYGNSRIVRIDLETMDAETVAGNGTCDNTNNQNGDGGPAIHSVVCYPELIGLDNENNLLIDDSNKRRVRRVIFNPEANGLKNYLPIAKDHSFLQQNSDGSYQLTYRNGIVENYDASGRITSIVDRQNRQTLYAYQNNRLQSITDHAGLVTAFVYSGENLQRIIDPAGRVTTLTQEEGLLTGVTFPDGNRRHFHYDVSGKMVTEQNELGHETHYEYSEWNRLAKVIKSDGSSVELLDRLNSTIGNSFVGGYSGTMVSIESDEAVDGIRDAKNQSTTYKSDESGFVTSITDAQGRVTRLERDLDGRPTKVTRPDESYAAFTYHSTTHDLTKKYDSSSGMTEEYSYDSYGNLLTRKDNRGTLISNSYSPSTGELLNSTNILGQSVSRSYSNDGLLMTQTDSLGAIRGVFRDVNGNVTKVLSSDGTDRDLLRDSYGNIGAQIDQKGNRTNYEYDIMNRLTKVTTPKGEETSYEYNAIGSLTKITDPYGNITTFLYDTLNRLTKKTDPLGRVTSLGYDSNGNLISEVDTMGRVKSFQYDSLDQLIKRVLPDNVYDLTYDVRGNLAEIVNNESKIEFEYDLINGQSMVAIARTSGRGTHLDFPSATLEYSYDEFGNRVQMITPTGNFNYNYDIGSRLTKITNPSGENFNFTYDQGNRLTRITRPGSTTDFSFDSENFLASVLHKKSSAVISKAVYTRDLVGNRLSKQTLLETENYGYDFNNQLTGVGSTLDSPEIFLYDQIGNRTQDAFGSYLYDQKRQLLTEDHRNFYTYDPIGNVSTIQSKINSDIKNFTYNSENRLIKLALFEGTTLKKEITYLYDALGRRVEKEVINHETSTTDTKRFVYDGDEILFDLDGENNLLSTYTHSTLRTDDLLSIDNGVKSFFLIKDGLGSTTEITDELGSVVQHYAYSAFGKIVSIKDENGNDVTDAPPIKNPFTYTGREWDDESSLYYYRARYYSPEIGRFLTVDPDAGSRSSPATFNSKYIYGLNSPMNLIDPSGEFSLSSFAGYAFSFDAAGLFDYSITESVKFDRKVYQAVGFNDPIDFFVTMATLGIINDVSISEKDQIFGTKIAVIVAMGGYGMDSGLVGGWELAGIGGLSGYQAFGQDGNWMNNSLNNMGGNLALTLTVNKGATFLPDNKKVRMGVAIAGATSLGYSIVAATLNIDKKY